MSHARTTFAALSTVAATLWLAACGDPLVGGRCLPGYTVTAEGCVRTSTVDGGRDGGDGSTMDRVVPADGSDGGDDDGFDVAPYDGNQHGGDVMDESEGGTIDGGPHEAGMNEGGTGDTGPGEAGMNEGGTNEAGMNEGGTGDTGPGVDGTSSDGTSGDGSSGDGGDDVSCPLSEMRCNGVCVDTTSDPANCGTCGTMCTSAQVCARGMCQMVCPAPLVNCNGACVDLQTDENNCGMCGHVCASGICNAGVCRDARAGHLILIGHAFGPEASRVNEEQILRNAVFLAASSPARVLAYEQYADTTPTTGEVAHADAAITAAGRPWNKTLLTASTDVSTQLSIDRYDVMLVYEQHNATDAQIAGLATDLGDALASFVRAGGDVVVLDGPVSNGGTFPIASATGLLHVTGLAAASNAQVTLNPPAAADAVAVGVGSPYRATTTSVTFTTTDSFTVFAVGTAPTVIHRAVLGP